MVQAILFDMDGTLVSLEPRYVSPVIDAIIEVLGEVPMEMVDKAFQDLLGTLGRKGIFLIPRVMWRIARGLGMSFFQSIRFLRLSKRNYKERRKTFEILDGAQDTIKLAKENYKIALVTSAFDDEIEVAMEKYPIFQEFDAVVGWDDVSKPKPDSEPVLKASQLLGVDPKETVFIGDPPTDIESGRRAGATTVAFAGKYFEYTVDLLKNENPDFIVRDHKELQKFLQELVENEDDLLNKG